MTHVTPVLVVLSLLVLAGCAQPQVAPSPNPDRQLGVAPAVTPDEPTPIASISPVPDASVTPRDPSPSEPGARSETPPPGASASPQPSVTRSPTDDRPVSSEPQSPATESEAPGPGEPVVLLAVADRTGDHGLQGPAWADLMSLELVEVGNDLRVTLRFDGELPSPPPEGQVPLINVDIGEGDTAYQLHVESDGRGDSWAAYLHTPQGFVQYPGTFELAGRALVLQVPFNAVGSPTRAPVRTSVEWSEDRPVLNASSEDRLDGQPHTFDRAP